MSNQITVSFASDDADEIAVIVAFWDVTVNENWDEKPLSWHTYHLYLRLFDVLSSRLDDAIENGDEFGPQRVKILASLAERLKSHD